MNNVRTISLVAICAALSACGDATGSVGLASTPAPIPAQAPPPAPTLPPVSAPVNASTNLAAVGATIGKGNVTSPDGAKGVSTSQILQPSQIAIGRDAAGGYTITLPVPTLQNGSFADVIRKVDFSADTESKDANQFTARQNSTSTAQGGDNKLYVFVEGLKYARFATLQVCNTPSGIDCPGDFWGFSVLALGSPTPLAEVPVSGAASYAGTFWATQDWFNSAAMNGKISLRLDFGTRAVSGSITSAQSWFDDALTNPKPQPIPDFAVTGQIGANGYLTGSVNQPAGPDSFDGTWTAGLFGPGAAEVAGVLRLKQTAKPENVYVGSFGAAKQ